MKAYTQIISLLGVLILMSCNTSDDTNIIPDPVLQLSENIDVYDASAIHNNVVLAIENGGTSAYLINKAGYKLFTWEFDTKLGNDLELLPNGKVIGMFKSENPVFSFGGFGGIIKIINPDQSVDWEFEYASDDYIAHHDVEMLANGNVLFLVWERITAANAQSVGVNVDHDLFLEKLVEVNPVTNTIVWEWRSWDHIVQDIDNSQPSFGPVASNPQLIDINYNQYDHGDLMHANGIDYDSNKDVIYMSVNFYSEIWVIDHSTTSLEASTSSGGNHNSGGDLLYRFGNPEAYKNPQGIKLFDKNHFPNLLEGNEPGAGNLLIFVNGTSIEQSTVYELEIPNTFELSPNTNNEPNVVWSFSDPELYFGRVSGAVRLSNGNTLICEGDYGYWEVTQSGEIVWKYNGLGARFWRGYSYDLNDVGLDNLGITF